MKSKYDRDMELCTPGQPGEDGWMSYESTWMRYMCEPEPEDIFVMMGRLKHAQHVISNYEFLTFRFRSILADFKLNWTH